MKKVFSFAATLLILTVSAFAKSTTANYEDNNLPQTVTKITAKVFRQYITTITFTDANGNSVTIATTWHYNGLGGIVIDGMTVTGDMSHHIPVMVGVSIGGLPIYDKTSAELIELLGEDAAKWLEEHAEELTEDEVFP